MKSAAVGQKWSSDQQCLLDYLSSKVPAAEKQPVPLIKRQWVWSEESSSYCLGTISTSMSGTGHPLKSDVEIEVLNDRKSSAQSDFLHPYM